MCQSRPGKLHLSPCCHLDTCHVPSRPACKVGHFLHATAGTVEHTGESSTVAAKHVSALPSATAAHAAICVSRGSHDSGVPVSASAGVWAHRPPVAPTHKAASLFNTIDLHSDVVVGMHVISGYEPSGQVQHRPPRPYCLSGQGVYVTWLSSTVYPSGTSMHSRPSVLYLCSPIRLHGVHPIGLTSSAGGAIGSEPVSQLKQPAPSVYWPLGHTRQNFLSALEYFPMAQSTQIPYVEIFPPGHIAHDEAVSASYPGSHALQNSPFVLYVLGGQGSHHRDEP
jgi:hypothetical protein